MTQKQNQYTLPQNKKQLRGITCALLGGCCWGFTGVCAQYLFSLAEIDSAWLASLRMTAGGLIMVIAGFILHGSKEMTRIFKDKADLRRMVIFGLAGLMFVQYTYFAAIQNTNAGTATTLQYTCPIMVMIYTCIRRRKAPGIYGILSICLVVIGVFLLACHGDMGNLAISPAGLFWGLTSAIAMACYTILPGNLVEKYGSLSVSGYGLIIGGIVLGIVCRIWTIPVTMTGKAWFIFAVIVLFGCILANMIYLRGVTDIGPMKATLFVSVEPVSAAFIALIWLHTPLGAADFCGIACVVAAVILYQTKGKQ